MPNEALGLSLLTNMLALPKRLENQTQQSALERAILLRNAADFGISPADIETLAPEPGLAAINPAKHPGVYGKILSGTGDVGSFLTAMLSGNPLSTPRIPLSTVATLGTLRDAGIRRQARDTFAESLTSPKAKAAARAGAFRVAEKFEGGGTERSPFGTGSLGNYIEIAKADHPDWSLAQARSWAAEQVNAAQVQRSKAIGQGAADRQVDAALTKEREQLKMRAGRVDELIEPLEGAIERQLHADSLYSRIKQAGKLFAFEQSPSAVAKVLGLTAAQSQQLAEDIETLKSPAAFAGQILKGLGEDAGRLSDYDIRRVANRMPGTTDARIIAQAKLKVFRRLIDSAKGYGKGERIPKELVDSYVRELDDLTDQGANMKPEIPPGPDDAASRPPPGSPPGKPVGGGGPAGVQVIGPITVEPVR